MKNLETELSLSEEYQSFRSSVPLRRIVVQDFGKPESTKTWMLFDCGPKDSRPIVFIPPVSGTADVFYLQCLGLSVRGYRVISVQSPPYWSVLDWCKGFKELLSQLDLEKVHLFGAALGGFLAQKFAEFTRPCPRVASLILCNTFTDTSVFNFAEQSSVFWLMPSSLMKSMILEGLETKSKDHSIVRAVDFMSERLDSLSQKDLSSRLSLNCIPDYVKPQCVNDLPVTIVDVWDECALSQQVKNDLYKSYPNAKLGHLKTGGNFPYLSRSDEVNLHILIHLRNYENTL